jgi:hypothetical protein
MRPTLRFFGRRIIAAILFLGAIDLSIAPNNPAQAMDAVRGGALPHPLPLFPADNWWNRDISNWPVDPNSAGYISFVNNGGTRRLHPDLGGDASTPQDPYAIYGMPYAVVSNVAASDLVAVNFYYASESDGVDHATNTSYPFYPIPSDAIAQPYWIEGGDPGDVDRRSSQDRHFLIVDYDRNYLYELYNVYYNATQGKWYAGSGAFFDMNANHPRTNTWTSADAAGLAILPGLVRYDEVYDPNVTEIRHAFRVTVRKTNGYVYPASHQAGSTQGALPMGARLRLKASVNVAQRTSDPNMQKIFRAMQKYGLIVADNGSDMYITGTYDTRWDNGVLNPAFNTLTAGDFEVIQLGYNPTVSVPALSSVSVTPSSVTGGNTTAGTVNLTAPAPAGGLTIGLSSTSTAATVAVSVGVGAGATSANFTVNTVPVSSTTTAVITASYNGINKTAALAVQPAAPAVLVPVLASVSLNPSTVLGGSTSTGTVNISAPAPTGGIAVTLSSNKPTKASMPANVTVAAGKNSATFTVSTVSVTSGTGVAISASYGGVTKNATLTIQKRKRR